MATLHYHKDGVGTCVSIPVATFTASSEYPRLNFKALVDQLVEINRISTVASTTTEVAPETEDPSQEAPVLPIKKGLGFYGSIIDRLEKKYCGRDYIDMEVASDNSEVSEEPSDLPEAKRKKKVQGDYYDLDDAFIDDSETCQEIESHLRMKRTKTARTGFFASTGELEIVKGSERLTVEKRKRESSTSSNKKRLTLPPPEPIQNTTQTSDQTSEINASETTSSTAAAKPKKIGVWKPNEAMTASLRAFITPARTYIEANPQTKKLSPEIEASLVRCYDSMEGYHRMRLFNKLGLCEAIVKELGCLSITYLKSIFARVRAAENSTVPTEDCDIDVTAYSSTEPDTAPSAANPEPPNREKTAYTGIWHPNEIMSAALNDFVARARAHFATDSKTKQLSCELEAALVDMFENLAPYRKAHLFNKLGLYEILAKEVNRLTVSYLRRVFTQSHGKEKINGVSTTEAPIDEEKCSSAPTSPMPKSTNGRRQSIPTKLMQSAIWKPTDVMTTAVNNFVAPVKEYLTAHPSATSLSPELEIALTHCFDSLETFRKSRLLNKQGFCLNVSEQLGDHNLSFNYLQSAIQRVKAKMNAQSMHAKFLESMEQVIAKIKSRVKIVTPRAKPAGASGDSDKPDEEEDDDEGKDDDDSPKDVKSASQEGVLTCRWDIPTRTMLHRLETTHSAYISSENSYRKKMPKCVEILDADSVFENEVLPQIATECFPPSCVKGDVNALKQALKTEKLRLRRIELKKIAKLEEEKNQIDNSSVTAMKHDTTSLPDPKTTEILAEDILAEMFPENIDDTVLFAFDLV